MLGNVLGGVVKSVTKTASDFVEDPIGTTVDVATQPIRDAVDVFEGLTEGEIRTKAALRLGADVVAGMAIEEVIDAYNAAE